MNKFEQQFQLDKKPEISRRKFLKKTGIGFLALKAFELGLLGEKSKAKEKNMEPQKQESPEAVEKRILAHLKKWFEKNESLLEKDEEGWMGINYEGFSFEYIKRSSQEVTCIDYNVDQFRFMTSKHNIVHEISFNPRFINKKIYGFGISQNKPDSSYTLKTHEEMFLMGYFLRDQRPRHYKEFSPTNIEQFMSELPNREEIKTGLQKKEEARKHKEERDKEYLKQLKPSIELLVSSGKLKKLEFGHEAQVSCEGIVYKLFYRGDALFIEATGKEKKKSIFISDPHIARLLFDDEKIIDYSNGLYKRIIEKLQK